MPDSPGTRWPRRAVAAWLASLGLVATAAAIDRRSFVPATGDVWINVAVALAYPAAGALILRSRPRHRVGLFLMLAGMSCSLTLISHAIAVHGVVLEPGSVPAVRAVVWLNEWIWTTGAMPAVALLPSLFPDGRLPNPASKLAATGGVGAVVLLALGAMFQPGTYDDFPTVENPLGVTALGDVLAVMGGVGFALFVLASATGLVAVAIRWHRSSDAARRQLDWFASATALLVVSVILDATALVPRTLGAAMVASAPLLIAASVANAVVRHRLYDVEVVVNRSVVYAVLTIMWVGTYSVGLATIGAAFGQFGAVALTTAVIAVAFDPVRMRVQHLVDRMLYGDRSAIDPVLDHLADQLATATTPASALRAVTDAAVAAFGATGATAVIVRDGSVVARQTTGSVGDMTDARPMLLRGEPVGELAIAVRVGDQRPSRRRQRQLDDVWHRILRSSELAAATVLLTSELQRSRAVAVTVGEEERRRIRRDLHDGLGPRLAGLALGIESVQTLDSDAPEVLRYLAAEAYATMDEVRAIVHGLRPGALDDLGLVRSIRERANALALPASTTIFAVDAPDDVPPLPAAIEVAALRIASEAMTNVVRHAAARRCAVRIVLTEAELTLSVDDDGVGIGGGSAGNGVGLGSMRERAVEVGGTLSITERTPSGTSVVAHLPRFP